MFNVRWLLAALCALVGALFIVGGTLKATNWITVATGIVWIVGGALWVLGLYRHRRRSAPAGREFAAVAGVLVVELVGAAAGDAGGGCGPLRTRATGDGFGRAARAAVRRAT
jgi:hypothetical protein